MSLVRELKEFFKHSNVLALAVAVVLGSAFALVVASFVDDILMQLIAAIGAKPDFEELAVTVRGTEIRYGAFLNALIMFLIVGVSVFFVVKAYNRLMRRELKGPESEVEILTQIRDALRERPPTPAT